MLIVNLILTFQFLIKMLRLVICLETLQTLVSPFDAKANVFAHDVLNERGLLVTFKNNVVDTKLLKVLATK